MSKKLRGAVLVTTGLSVALVLAGFGPVPLAGAAGKQWPPPPKPAKPRGPTSGINFDTWGPAASDDVVLKWDEQALAEIRATRPGPTVVARALAVVHTAMYDAWAAYDATAVGTRLGGSLRRPAEERTADFKSKAISYAAYRALLDLFPTRAGDLTGFMADLGYDPADASVDPTTPQGVGNLTAQAVLEFRHRDGANHLGDEPGGTPGCATRTRAATARSTPGTRSMTPTAGSRCACRPRRRARPVAGERSSGSPPPSGAGSPRSRSPLPPSSRRRPSTGPSCPMTPSSWSTSRPN